MIANIDGDLIVYRVGFTTQQYPVGIACARTDNTMANILARTKCSSHKVFLTSTDKSNFRFEIYPEYKANRKAPKPEWYEEIRQHLIAEYRTEVVFGREADDALGIAQSEDSCIVSIDKDLDQVPGLHYDFVKDVMYEVSKENALRFFYYQLLVGDSTDNIPGCKGIGPKKAETFLEGCTSVKDYEETCIRLYREVYGEKWYDYITKYGQCLKIMQEEGEELWLPTLEESKQEEREAS